MCCLPNKSENFAADVLFSGFFICHNALGCRDDGDAESLHNTGHILATGIDTKTGLRYAAQALNDLFLAGTVLENYSDDSLLTVFDYLKIADISFLLEDVGNCILYSGRRNINSFVLGRVSIADTSEHICYNVCYLHEM